MAESKKTGKRFAFWPAFLLLSVVICASCASEVYEKSVLAPPDTRAGMYAFGQPKKISLQVLEELRKDTVFRMMVKAWNVKTNRRILDSLKQIATSPEEFRIMCHEAVKKLQEPFAEAYRAKLPTYPRDFMFYFSYECSLRDADLIRPRTDIIVE